MSKITLNVPDIGGAEAEVIEVLVHVGDKVEIDTSLFVLEGDKASMEVPAEQAGVVAEVLLKVGDTAEEGMPMIVLEAATANSEAPKDHVTPEEKKPGSSQTIDLIFPDLGTDDAVDVIDITAKAGDEVAPEQNLLTLEGDKASMDIPAPAAGKIVEMTVKVGDKVKTGDVFGKMEIAATGAVSESVEASGQSRSDEIRGKSRGESGVYKDVNEHFEEAFNKEDRASRLATIYAGPSVRRIASELSVDLTKVHGTGNKGRITKEDLKAFLSGGTASGGSALPFEIAKAPKVDFAKYGSVKTIELNKIKRATAANMARNWITIPHVTQFGDADITELEAYRQKHKDEALKDGVRLTPIAFILKAIVKVLKQHPNVNASLSADGKELIVKNYYHIGVAVDTPEGLVVPVIRDVDQKSVMELARELGEVSAKARDGKLKMSDMQGGTFTISSLGGIGGTAFTPIVNAPEVAILGVSKSAMTPVYNKETKVFDARLMLPLSLSYDHRVIDGAQGARFVVDLSNALADVCGLLL